MAVEEARGEAMVLYQVAECTSKHWLECALRTRDKRWQKPKTVGKSWLALRCMCLRNSIDR